MFRYQYQSIMAVLDKDQLFKGSTYFSIGEVPTYQEIETGELLFIGSTYLQWYWHDRIMYMLPSFIIRMLLFALFDLKLVQNYTWLGKKIDWYSVHLFCKELFLHEVTFLFFFIFKMIVTLLWNMDKIFKWHFYNDNVRIGGLFLFFIIIRLIFHQADIKQASIVSLASLRLV